MTVINTPLLLNPDLSLLHITQGVRECVYQSAPGPHVIVLVLNHECSREEAVCVDIVLSVFSELVFEHTIVLTTQEPERVELNEVNDVVKEIIDKCFNRHYRRGKNSTSADLIAALKEIVQRNDGRPLTCDKYLHFTSEGTLALKLEKSWKTPTGICQSVYSDHLKMSTKTTRQTIEKHHRSGGILNIAHEIKHKWSSKIADGSNETLPIFKLQLEETWKNSE
ncbi:GTPase IMAP family member 7-like [Danio aesculapii]|uniref:GTPase IMAP family member 7-like n=1 Tax=Danio aesculapii TaxID=1142201 RepID=UPI0024C007B1|nr:GTPase IMAP family member 7-like [Danio aesculapii]